MNFFKVTQNTVKGPRLDAFTRLLHILNKLMLLPTNLKRIKETIRKCPNKIKHIHGKDEFLAGFPHHKGKKYL